VLFSVDKEVVVQTSVIYGKTIMHLYGTTTFPYTSSTWPHTWWSLMKFIATAWVCLLSWLDYDLITNITQYAIKFLINSFKHYTKCIYSRPSSFTSIQIWNFNWWNSYLNSLHHLHITNNPNAYLHGCYYITWCYLMSWYFVEACKILSPKFDNHITMILYLHMDGFYI
jgi:hypothetical protein